MADHPPTARPEGEEEDLTGPAALERGRLLFARECRFTAGATRVEQLPPGGLPEIAFAGRSNVGKSSLVNALTGRRTLARVSQTPGRTQQINFFDLGGRLCLVDLPGYGYHQAGKSAAAGWARLIEQYLRGRAELRRVLVLIDGRQGVKDSDEAVMRLLDDAALSFQGVLTKSDKCDPPELAAVVDRTQAALRRHVAAHPILLTTSSEAGAGIPELRAAMAALALPADSAG